MYDTEGSCPTAYSGASSLLQSWQPMETRTERSRNLLTWQSESKHLYLLRSTDFDSKHCAKLFEIGLHLFFKESVWQMANIDDCVLHKSTEYSFPGSWVAVCRLLCFLNKSCRLWLLILTGCLFNTLLTHVNYQRWKGDPFQYEYNSALFLFDEEHEYNEGNRQVERDDNQLWQPSFSEG